MDWTSAPSIVVAPPEPARRPLFAPRVSALFETIETFLERERAQLPAWLVVALAVGIAAWFVIGDARGWVGFAIVSLGLAAAGSVFGRRTGRALLLAGLAMALGLGWAWLRSERVAAPVLDRPKVVEFEGRVEKVELRAAKGDARLTLSLTDPTLPPRIRVTVPEDTGAALGRGGKVRMKARLQPPPPMVFPGTHDFARDSWFAGIGAVGKALGMPSIVESGHAPPLDRVRHGLEENIADQLDGAEAGIATALVTGTQAAVPDEDADAMRRSGLTHLLSVSGLHIAAVVGAAMFLALRLLALSERMALRFNLVLVAAGAGAAAGIGYTLLTGMQVPTVRSCVAALLVLLGIALGRDAISMRLVASGALVVLIFRPEALVGVSFQLSFTAAAAIVALHGSAWARRWLSKREEGFAARTLRGLAGLLATGLVVEAALMPLTLYHFHRAGLYAVGANMLAIPWTTFVVMPLEFLALLAEPVGLGGPAWSLAGWAIGRLIALAHFVASAEGSVATLPNMPPFALASMVIGGLWCVLWIGKVRIWGVAPILFGAAWAASAKTPDLLVSGDGRHVAILTPDGRPLLLRERTGDFTTDLVSETAAFDGVPGFWQSLPGTRCSRDACVADVVREGRAWRVLAIRTRDSIAWRELTGACANSDIVIADRFLPRGCTPRWLKLDRPALESTGGLTIRLGQAPLVDTVAARLGQHPWRPLARSRPLP